MLMLQLTDGAVEVQGMEYRPIPALNASLIPGTKVKYQPVMALNDNVIPGTECRSYSQHWDGVFASTGAEYGSHSHT